MSGRKYSMASYSYADIQSSNSYSSTASYDASRKINELRNQLNQNMEKQKREADRRFSNIEQSVSHLGKDVVEQEKFMKESLHRQQKTIDDGFANVGRAMNAMETKVSERINNLSRTFNNSLQDIQSRFKQYADQTDKRLNGLSDRIGNIEQGRKYAKDETDNWLRYAETVYTSVRAIPALERFAPGRLAELDRDIRDAKRYYNNGAYDASLSGARTAALNLNRLRIDVERAIQIWEQMRSLAQAQAELLLDEVQHNTNVVAVGSDGKELPDVDLETDFWTEGKFCHLEEAVRTDLEVLAKPDCPWDTPRIQTWFEKQPEKWKAELTELCKETRSKALLSQYRTEMGDILCERLRVQGFAMDGVDEPLFENLDERRALLCSLVAPDGARVVVRIAPVPDQFKNVIEINSYDASSIPVSQLEKRRKDINDILSEELNVTMEEAGRSQLPDPNVEKAFKKSRAMLKAESTKRH